MTDEAEEVFIGSANSNNQHNYQSDETNGKRVLGNGSVRNLNWTWISQKDNSAMTTSSKPVLSSYIKFSWDHSSQILGLTGKVTFKVKQGNGIVANKIVDVLVEYSGQWVGEKCLVEIKPQETLSLRGIMSGSHSNQNNNPVVEFMSFELYPVFEFLETINALANFEKSEKTDAILEVEGKQLHVNKSFLSFHSDFFSKLFHSDFKEKDSPVIPIKQIGLDDFAHFLSLIYPKSQDPTIEKVSKYLEMADMYMMPMVTEKCETFLLRHERIKPIQKIVFADKHHLSKLLRETLGSVSTETELKAFTRLPEFNGLSESTKAAILHRFMHFFN